MAYTSTLTVDSRPGYAGASPDENTLAADVVARVARCALHSFSADDLADHVAADFATIDLRLMQPALTAAVTRA